MGFFPSDVFRHHPFIIKASSSLCSALLTPPMWLIQKLIQKPSQWGVGVGSTGLPLRDIRGLLQIISLLTLGHCLLDAGPASLTSANRSGLGFVAFLLCYNMRDRERSHQGSKVRGQEVCKKPWESIHQGMAGKPFLSPSSAIKWEL